MDFAKTTTDKPSSTSGAEPQVSPFATSAQEQYQQNRHLVKLGVMQRSDNASASAPASDNTLLYAGTAAVLLAGAAAYGLSRGKVSPFKFLTQSPSAELKTSYSLGMVSEHGKPLSEALDVVLHGKRPGYSSDFAVVAKFAERRDIPALSIKPSEELVASKYAVRLSDDHLTPATLSEVRQKEKIWLDHDFDNFPTPLPWQPGAASIEARAQAQSFVRELNNRNYEGALRSAIDIPVMRRVELNPPGAPFDVQMRAADLKQVDISLELSRMGQIGKFNGDTWQVKGQLETKLKVLLPRPTIELSSGTKVHLYQFETAPSGAHTLTFPTKSIDEVPLKPLDLTEIQAVRESPQGQRILEETAIIAFEENIVHANQFARGSYDLLSPSYAKFAGEWADATGSRSHFDAFRGALMHGDKGRFMVKEQEVPFVAYDAGMPLQTVLDHFYFGSRHVGDRASSIFYLLRREGQEALVPGLSKPTK